MATQSSVPAMSMKVFTDSDMKLSGMEDLSEDLLSTCSVCELPFDMEKRIAKYLPCYHTFCLACLRAISSSTVIITCPLCHKTHTCNYGVDSLKSNVHAIHIAKKSAEAEKAKHLQRSVESWCLTCEAVASLMCYFGSPKHSTIGVGSCTIREAEDLQKLLKEMPQQKALAIEKRKQIQVHLGAVMQSLVQVQDSVKDMMVKNDQQLGMLLTIKDLVLPQEKEMSVATVREHVMKLAIQLKESLSDGIKMCDELELQKRIRVLLNLRSAENQPIPTFALFEDGFYSNWTMTENLSITDRNLMVVSHLIFAILKRWNIPLRVKRPSGNFYSSLSLLPTPSSKPPPGIAVANNNMEATSVAVAASISHKKSSPILDCVWGSTAPVLSYSQVLNLPKPMNTLPSPPKGAENMASSLPSFIFRFEEKGNGKYNVPSKFLGEVLVRVSLSAHVNFVQQMANYCHSKSKEATRRISKASPGMFVMLQAESPPMIDAVPAMHGLSTWESSERTKDAWDVGINSALEEGQVIGWKFIFLLEKFKPNNMEVTMLFGKVREGREVLQRLSARTKQDRFNLVVTVKTA